MVPSILNRKNFKFVTKEKEDEVTSNSLATSSTSWREELDYWLHVAFILGGMFIIIFLLLHLF